MNKKTNGWRWRGGEGREPETNKLFELVMEMLAGGNGDSAENAIYNTCTSNFQVM